MNKLSIMAKVLAVACAVMAGAVVSAFFLQDLLDVGAHGEPASLSHYASLASDWAASMMAGVLMGWLVYFCLWDCLANWLGGLWAHLKSKFQLNGQANRA